MASRWVIDGDNVPIIIECLLVIAGQAYFCDVFLKVLKSLVANLCFPQAIS